MAFQTPITIATTLERIRKQQYVLPAIQREFVWGTEQICRLFDSLMRGYPIGSFLFWHVEPTKSREFAYYGFIRDFHARDAFHLPRVDLPATAPVTAILDGQQRLTSLYIGLHGSFSERTRYQRVNNALSYPKRFLYLNIAAPASENDLGMEHDFQFLTPERAASDIGEGVHWFKVGDIRKFEDGVDMHDYVIEHDLALNRHAFRILDKLHSVVTKDPVINYFEEDAQDLDKVLNIFIRVNSGGTVLSYSDLLLSIATAQWTEVDARDAVHGLVDDLNETGQGFKFSKDIVLKAGLMLSDIPSVAFRVTNFNATNMALLQQNWSRISTSLRLAAQLLADFGFSERTLTADSVLIPLAYYLHARKLDERYLTAAAYAADREQVRLWVVRSLVKSGVWGSGLDTLLTYIRTVIREEGGDGFPVAAIEATMSRLGKSLRFEQTEVQELLDIRYGDKRVFPVLSLLYPGMNFRHEFHADHVFPKSLTTARRLTSAGIPPDEHGGIADAVNRLGNLQLLEGPVNTSKSNKLPGDWLGAQLGGQFARDAYIARHDLGELPASALEFDRFYEARRERMAARLRALLGVAEPEGSNGLSV